MTSYLCAGMKYGDLASALCILCEIHRTTGEKPTIVVAKKYADLAEDCPCVTADIWDGDWQDVKGALRYAKKKYRKVVCLSTFGSGFPVEHRYPSFQIDQYSRAGMVEKFGTLPLKLKEGMVATDDWSGAILIGDKSESAPFDKRDELLKLVLESFPDKKVVLLSQGAVNRISDFVSIYDRAAALVTLDTVHLHLSAASKVPVLAFIRDTPELWQGSAYQPRLRFHCRYSDFEQRKTEFIKVLSDAVNKVEPPKFRTVTGLFENNYNPSIIQNGDGYLMAYRFHQPDGMSRIGMAELDADFKVRRNAPISIPAELEKFSVEDPRCFLFQGRLHISYVAAKWPMPPFLCVVGYGAVEKHDGEWRLLKHIQPKVGRNDFSTLEKNFVFHEHGGKLFTFYGDGRVMELSGDKVMAEHKTELLKWPWGTPHGGALVPYKGKLLRFFHARTEEIKDGKFAKWCYRIGICVHDATPPFRMTHILPFPIITADEGFVENKYYKKCIAFPAGAVLRDGKFYLSWGWNDCECRIAEIEEKHLGL